MGSQYRTGVCASAGQQGCIAHGAARSGRSLDLQPIAQPPARPRPARSLTRSAPCVDFHTAAQREVALAHKAAVAARLGKPVAPEVLPATRFWEAEAVHQKYLEKGTGGRAQSAAKLCSDPVRCYG